MHRKQGILVAFLAWAGSGARDNDGVVVRAHSVGARQSLSASPDDSDFTSTNNTLLCHKHCANRLRNLKCGPKT